MTPRRLALAVLLAPAGLLAGDSEPDHGGLWRNLSGPFRRQAVSVPPSHTAVAAAVAARRARRSPFMVPMAVQPRSGKGGPLPNKLLSRDQAKQMLQDTSSRLAAVEEMFQNGAVDKAAKELDSLNSRISATVFPDLELRHQGEDLSERITRLKRRATVRMAFAKLNPQVTFIICASQEEGKSLAVVNQRIIHPGDPLPGGLKIARITPHEVVFALEGEEIAVGLK